MALAWYTNCDVYVDGSYRGILLYIYTLMKLLDKIALHLICRSIGYDIVKEDRASFTADCARCGLGLSIAYDMMYGDTYVTDEFER